MKCEDTDGKANGSSCRPAYAGTGQARTEGLFLHPSSFIAKSCAHPDDIVRWWFVPRFVVTGLLEDMLLDGCLTREA